MTEDEAFQSAIQANLLDDLPRLAYADWLDEQGRTDAAEYLRLVGALATGTAVDINHPHAVRLLTLVPELEPQWRREVGGRFDLWFDEIRSSHKIHFIKCVRQITGYGLFGAKAFSESLPGVLSGPVPLEEAVVQVAVMAEAVVRHRIVPSTEVPSCGLLRCCVVLRWWAVRDEYDADPQPAPSRTEGRAVLVHLRRILTRAPKFVALAASIPEELREIVDEYSIPLADDLLVDEATRRAEELSSLLLGGEQVLGLTAAPPFAGSIGVRIAFR